MKNRDDRMHWLRIRPWFWQRWLQGVGVAALAVGLTGCVSVGPEDVGSADISYPAMSLNNWRLPHGDWTEVGNVDLDPADSASFRATPGTGILINGTGRTLNLVTEAMYGDVKIHVEFNVPEGSNSGVYLQGRYEIQILDSWGVQNPSFADCGGIYERWRNDEGFEGRPPAINACLRPGAWQTLDLVFQAPRFNELSDKVVHARFVEVRLNGVVIHRDAEVTGPTRAAIFPDDEKPIGPLMLQGDHGPVAYRNLFIQEIELP